MTEEEKQTEGYFYKMHDRDDITLVIEIPIEEAEEDVERNAIADSIRDEIVSKPDEWYLDEVLEPKELPSTADGIIEHWNKTDKDGNKFHKVD